MTRKLDSILSNKGKGSTDSKQSTTYERREQQLARSRALAEQYLAQILEFSDYDRLFAAKLCKDIADKFGSDDEMSSIIMSRIRVDRTNKKRGPRKKWTDIYLLVLLHEYCALKKAGEERNEILNLLAESHGLSGHNKVKKIKQRISEAKRLFNRDDMPDDFKDFY